MDRHDPFIDEPQSPLERLARAALSTVTDLEKLIAAAQSEFAASQGPPLSRSFWLHKLWQKKRKITPQEALDLIVTRIQQLQLQSQFNAAGLAPSSNEHVLESILSINT